MDKFLTADSAQENFDIDTGKIGDHALHEVEAGMGDLVFSIAPE